MITLLSWWLCLGGTLGCGTVVLLLRTDDEKLMDLKHLIMNEPICVPVIVLFLALAGLPLVIAVVFGVISKQLRGWVK